MAVSVNLQKKIFPKIYDYRGNYACEISEAINISDSRRFGSIGTLSFDMPFNKVDAWNIVRTDKLISEKVGTLQNEARCLFDNEWYIIKTEEHVRDDSNKQLINCSGMSIGYLLQELMVEYLNLTPPIALAVNATNAIKAVLESAQQVRDNIIVSATSNTSVLDVNAHPMDGVYVGYKIKILSGLGVGQERIISSYNGTTKSVGISSNWTTIPNTTSVYRIYNDVWQVGTVASEFNTDLRAHSFDFINALDALQQVRDKYFNASDDVGYLTYTSNYNYTTNRWENKVNLVAPNDYDSVEFRYAKNIKSLTRRKESQEIYTRIIPMGINNLTVGSIATSYIEDESSAITYPEHILGYNYIDNFQYYMGLEYTYKECLDNFIKVYKFDDARYTTASALYADAKKMLQKMSIPKYTYMLTALDLSVITGREYESFKSGDTIRVIDEDYQIDILATIGNIDRSQDAPQNATIEITNFIEDISNVIARISKRGDVYVNLKSKFGSTATYIIADKLTSKNWRQADYVIQEFESASYVIQKVIDEATAKGGGAIVLLEGDYGLTSTLEAKSNVTIQCTGVATRLYPKGSNVSVAISVVGQSNVVIKSLFIDYVPNPFAPETPINYFQNGISISGTSDNVTIEEVSMEYISNNYLIAQSSSNIYVSRNTFDSKTIYYMGTDIVDLKDCNNARVVDNVGYINGMAERTIFGIDILSGTSTGDFVIARNKITQVGNGSLFFLQEKGSIDVNTIGNVTIEDNVFIIKNGSFQVDGIRVRRADGGCSVSRNKLYNDSCADTGIRVDTIVSKASILNNDVVVGNGTGQMGGDVEYGIRIDGDNCFVSGNTVKKISGEIVNYGLFINSTADKTTASNNILVDSWAISAYQDNGTNTQVNGGNRTT